MAGTKPGTPKRSGRAKGTAKAAEKRAYRSPRRSQQARETRRAIRDAASALFLDLGYGATSIVAIAERAGVAPETVYSAFGTKRDLLFECLDVAIVGDDEPVPLLDRPWFAAMQQERSARKRVRAMVDNGSSAAGRSAAFDGVIRNAAGADPKIAARMAQIDAARFGDTRRMVEVIAETGNMRLDVDDATDLIYAIGSPAVYGTLVAERGWTHERFLDEMYELAVSALLRERRS